MQVHNSNLAYQWTETVNFEAFTRKHLQEHVENLLTYKVKNRN